MNSRVIDKVLSHFFINNNQTIQTFSVPSNQKQTKELSEQYLAGFKKSFKQCITSQTKGNEKYSECYELDIKNRIKQVIQWRKQFVELLKFPLIEQKTKEWYELRQQCLTASDFAQSLGKGKFGKPEDIIIKKSYNHDKLMDFKYPLWWGQKYEPTAISIYEHLMNTKVYEFGLMKNPNHKFFGASPDGISELGVMLEIKCPYKRKPQINPIVPEQYYYQIQGQLDTCGLTECDYLDCFIQEFKTRQDFFKDLERYTGYGPKFVGNKVFYGMILCKYLDQSIGEDPDSYELDELYPVRSPVHYKYEELIAWEQDNIPYNQCVGETFTPENSDMDDDEEELLRNYGKSNLEDSPSKKQKLEKPKYKVIYWKCYSHDIIPVDFNKEFFNKKIMLLEELDYEKTNDYHEDHKPYFNKLNKSKK